MLDPIVPGSSPELWRSIVAAGAARRFVPGEVLLHQGACGRTCFAIERGSVLVTVNSALGATLVLGRRGPGQLVGELAALEGKPRSATVSAETDVDAIAIDSETFVRLLQEHPDWALQIIRLLARRVRTLSERFAIRGEDLRARVLAVLRLHLDETGDDVFLAGREEFAGWIGATREAVIRELRGMQDDGLVRLRRGAVELTQAGREASTTTA